jgi:hypothetical protein
LLQTVRVDVFDFSRHNITTISKSQNIGRVIKFA